jgi:hypothetical protein
MASGTGRPEDDGGRYRAVKSRRPTIGTCSSVKFEAATQRAVGQRLNANPEQFLALIDTVLGPPPGQASYRECPGPGWHLCTLPGHNDPPHWVMGSEPDPPHVIDVQSQSEQEGDSG